MIDHYFGTVTMAMTVVQALLGWYHHRIFQVEKLRGHTHAHIWLGRVTIICGMINCGFGLLLVPVKVEWAIIWWVGCGVITMIYISAQILLRVRSLKEIRGKQLP